MTFEDSRKRERGREREREVPEGEDMIPRGAVLANKRESRGLKEIP